MITIEMTTDGVRYRTLPNITLISRVIFNGDNSGQLGRCITTAISDETSGVIKQRLSVKCCALPLLFLLDGFELNKKGLPSTHKCGGIYSSYRMLIVEVLSMRK